MRPTAIVVSLTLVLGVLVVPAAQTPPARIVAIGDIHGALPALVRLLTTARLIDGDERWSGGRATLVQTGDYTDRGPFVRGVLDLLIRLEEEAAAAGGAVRPLLGNHEVMNLLGEYRDVTPAIFATFADEHSEQRRQAAFAAYAALSTRRRDIRQPPAAVYTQTRDSWMAAHPAGWLEYHDALSPSGRYGRWLRARPVAAVIGGTLFMHAGPDPTAAHQAPDVINARVAAELSRVDRFRERLVAAGRALPFFTLDEVVQVAAAEIRAVNAAAAAARMRGVPSEMSSFDLDLIRDAADVVTLADWDVLAQNGPLWYRGYAAYPEATLQASVSAFLSRLSLSRIVVGHSPVRDRRILARLGGSVVLIDTGMLASAYKGRASALEIVGDTLTAIYDDGRVRLLPRDLPRHERHFLEQ